ncbi:hypothetical protein M404DRAFT_16132 [Pisolithus tinctorius Marx 270]|uniref:G-patch domain-containing protein n=1 Tax=Pisolithus tinctorius Marx 270 TaxID=870435 RepID=A0A0C3P580_PISTI|nr:hypothetical protein M404DRAFT_16132 [Pisolithus tinctorius Marx 270]
MSEQSIARWNAIPMERQELEKEQGRDPDDSGDGSEDNVSLVSRSPSPPPQAMDIDKYDEYIRGAPREIITVETKIKSTNKGFAMLAKLGWSEGQPLGLSGDGRTDPIPFHIKNDLTGLGKTNQDFRMIETTVAQRRVLDSERQRKETEDQRKTREDIVARRAAVKSEITDTLRPFYCALCEKQFQNVAQYDEHTNSYAHHHKARLRDMQANARPMLQEEVEKRKEKERKREEKELRKLAKAAGIKITKPPPAASPVPVLAPATSFDTANVSETKSSGFKKAGWTTISISEAPSEADFTRTGRSAVDPATTSYSRPPSLPRPTPPSPPPPRQSPAAPSFRAGGWTTLDTGNSKSFPSSPPPREPSAPPPSPPPTLAFPPPPPADDSPRPPPPPPLPGTSQVRLAAVEAKQEF